MPFTGTHIVVHYHEIALKGRNRPRFIATLTGNIREATRDLGVVSVRSLPGRILITLAGGGAASSDAVIARLQKIFGIVSLSPTWRVEPTLEDLESRVPAEIAASGRAFASFRVSTRRAEKGFPYTSPEVNARVGAVVQRATGARVDLETPEFTVWIEILGREALFHFEKLPGPGGLPVGSGGTVACLISGGIDSPVAAYRMMKRGCPVVFVHFHSEPYLDRTARAKTEELVELLTGYQGASDLHLVPFGEIQKEISLKTQAEYRVVLYRRMMLRIAERIAGRSRALALATGESLGQVASQTLENIVAIDSAATLPVLRPLIGMDKEEIIREARAIGTFDISALRDQDCCQLFVPRHPATKARARQVAVEERRLEIEAMTAAALERTELKRFGEGEGARTQSTADLPAARER